MVEQIIMRSGSNTLNGFNFDHIVPASGADFEEQVRSCIEQLNEFGIEPVVRIISAHRTPKAAAEFAKNAAAKGTKVIIAAAGMAAHLAGSLAGQTTLPVIGVPLISSSGLKGIDALLSTVQMPPGVPVATVAIGAAGARNAAILAVQILALADKPLAGKLAKFKKDQGLDLRGCPHRLRLGKLRLVGTAFDRPGSCY